MINAASPENGVSSTLSSSPSSAANQPPTSSPTQQRPTVNQPPKSNTRKKYLIGIIFLLILIIGGGATYWLTQQNQDIRQQASEGTYECEIDSDCDSGYICFDYRCVEDVPGYDYECSINDPTACENQPENCHCLGGDRCYGTECDPNIGGDCVDWGRSYCTNYQGYGMTCCAEGYGCCSGYDGCCPLESDPSPPPSDGPTPPPTDDPSPQCLNITISKDQPELGDQVTFTCAQVADVDHYIFRVKTPDGEFQSLAATGRQSAPFTITEPGQYYGQCQICTGTSNTTCGPWENL